MESKHVINETAVLVVDRNALNQEILADLLGRAGYRVVASDSLEAWDRALAEELIHFALLDAKGFDTRIWERCDRMNARNIPFLALSSRPDPSLREACLAHGARAVLAKPVTINELLGAIRGLLH